MITFRKATVHDSQDISALVNSAYRGESSKVGWTTEADLLGGQRTDPAKISEIISTPESQIILAFRDGDLVGCIYLNLEKTTLYFGMLTVKPNLQNLGIGKLLLNKMEDIARELHCKSIRMTVISSRKELIAYYERRGFVWTGKVEPFPEHDIRFGIPNTKLEFHEFLKTLSE
jgi:ribosomal protein S18 acetylase RimI-like enzyme